MKTCSRLLLVLALAASLALLPGFARADSIGVSFGRASAYSTLPANTSAGAGVYA